MNMEYFYGEVNRKSYKLSNLEIEGLVVDDIGSNVVETDKREVRVRLSDVYALDKMERKFSNEATKDGVYSPNMSLKLSAPKEAHIIVYNLGIFLREDGRLIVPEGVSVISCSSFIRCKSVRFPKTLSSIIKLRIKCEGTINLKNVRFLNECEIEAKRLILPYTLERISSYGLTLYGSTQVITEKTPYNDTLRTGSLGVKAIQDERDKGNMFYLSNRFCNLYSDSLPKSVRFFREQDRLKYKVIKDIFIRDYYPHFLYSVVDDTI